MDKKKWSGPKDGELTKEQWPKNNVFTWEMGETMEDSWTELHGIQKESPAATRR